MSRDNQLLIFTGNANPKLASDIAGANVKATDVASGAFAVASLP